MTAFLAAPLPLNSRFVHRGHNCLSLASVPASRPASVPVSVPVSVPASVPAHGAERHHRLPRGPSVTTRCDATRNAADSIDNANASSDAKPKPRKSILTARNSLLPKLVPVARWAWRFGWRILMSELAPSDAKGRYKRPDSTLSSTSSPAASVVQDVAKGFAQRDDPAKHVLYVGDACPWCHRVTLALALLCVEQSYDVRRVVPGTDGLWRLEVPSRQGDVLLKDVYLALDGTYSGRFTAPLLVDEDAECVLSNESADVLHMLADRHARTQLPDGAIVCLCDDGAGGLDGVIDWQDVAQLAQRIHSTVNDGVYRSGFATSQTAYDEAEGQLFACLDDIEARLAKSRFLCSDVVLSEADVRLFPTVFRFDSVYSGIFRLFRKSVRADYPHVSRWLRDVYHLGRVCDTCDLSGTLRQYYGNLFPLNAGGIVPVPPAIDLSPL